MNACSGDIAMFTSVIVHRIRVEILHLLDNRCSTGVCVEKFCDLSYLYLL